MTRLPVSLACSRPARMIFFTRLRNDSSDRWEWVVCGPLSDRQSRAEGLPVLLAAESRRRTPTPYLP